jgi:squalene-hopene/tetraprenyl-beta-curcumene cyclase
MTRRDVACLCAALALALAFAPACSKESKKEGAGDEPAAPASAPTAAPAPTTAPPEGPRPVDLDAVRAAINRGIDYLVASRDANGMIGGHPGVTALAVVAIALSPDKPDKDDPRLAPSLEMLAKLARKDGSFTDEKYPVYTTALAILAFQTTGAHPELIAPAQAWLANAQLDESDGVKPTDSDYGGIGYGAGGKADLSNLHFALEALHESHFKDRPEVYERALEFIERCQNRTESNDMPGVGNDGGFMYRPGESKAGGLASSGSMTYAGVKSFIYAGVERDDPRVTAALDWLRKHYTLTENPGLGTKGLYFYYQVFARALSLLGDPSFVDANGVSHDWYGDLARELLPKQAADGSWVNADPTYWESNAALATSRALLALDYGWPLASGRK